MAYINKTITAHELRQWVKDFFEYGHDDGIDEPYEGAGYCSCAMCQEIVPRMEAAAATIEHYEKVSVAQP